MVRYSGNVFTLSIWTDMPEQTVKSQNRCHRMRYLDQDQHCLPLFQKILDTPIRCKNDLFKF